MNIRKWAVLFLVVGALTAGQVFAQQEGRFYKKWSEIENQSVAGSGFEGSIADLVLTRDGHITHVVVDASQLMVEGDSGVDRKVGEAGSMLVPVDRISFARTEEQVTAVELEEQEVEQLSELEDGKLPVDLDLSGIEVVGQNARLILASTIQEYNFVDEGRQDLGGVEGFMLDLTNNRVSYIALSSGGFLGMGGDLVGVPMDMIIDWDSEEQQMVLELSQQVVETAQGFESDDWPEQVQWRQVPGDAQADDEPLTE
jgi:hypothetical protein